MLTTSVTLLERLRSSSSREGWSRFVDLYTPMMFQWARNCGLSTEDAADLIQDVFAALLKKLPDFTYDSKKTFRGWLKTVTLNLWRDRQRAVATRRLPGGGEWIEDVVGPDPVKLFEEEEYRTYLVSQALKLMQTEFNQTTWRAAWLYGVDGRPADDVAKELGISVTAVYCAKSRVLNRLRRELSGLIE